MLGQGSEAQIEREVSRDALGWASVGVACERRRDGRGRGSAKIQFLRAADELLEPAPSSAGGYGSSGRSSRSAGSAGPTAGSAHAHEALADRLSGWGDALLGLVVDASALASLAAGDPKEPGPRGCLLCRTLRCWDAGKEARLVLGLSPRERRSPFTGRHVALLEALAFVAIEPEKPEEPEEGQAEGRDTSDAGRASSRCKALATAVLASAQRYREHQAGQLPVSDAPSTAADGVRRRRW